MIESNRPIKGKPITLNKVYNSCWKKWYIIVRSCQLLEKEHKKWPAEKLFQLYVDCWEQEEVSEEEIIAMTNGFIADMKKFNATFYREYFWEYADQETTFTDVQAFMWLFCELKRMLKNYSELNRFKVIFDPILYRFEKESELFD